MPKPRLAWAITGSGHYIEDCLAFLLTLDAVDVYLSQAGEEVLKMYGISLNDVRAKMPVYRDKAASAPPVGHFYKGYYHTFVMAPTTSNTVGAGCCRLGGRVSLWPIGSSLGKNFRAADWLSTITFGARPSSVSAKIRPAMSGMCIVEKYEGLMES